MKNEWVQELGCSWENDVFGGQVTLHPSYIDRENGRGYFMFAAVQDWPNPEMGSMSGVRVPGEELQLRKIYPTPTLWLSFLSTQEYWDQWTTKYGVSALRFPKILYAARLLTRDHAVRRLRVDYKVREMRTALRESVAALSARKQQWVVLRPWHYENYVKWAVTPWADVHYRAALERYIEAHNARDEVKAQMAYEEIDFGTLLRGTETRNWYWQGITWLMYLCLPERNIAVSMNDGATPSHGRWRPSQASRIAGVTWEFEPLARNVGQPPPYNLMARHSKDSQGSRKRSHAYVKKFFEEKARIYPVHIDLNLSFWSSWSHIGRKMRSTDLGEGDWIDFDFELPTYQGYQLDIAVYGGVGASNLYQPWQGTPSLKIENYDLSSADSATERGDPFDDWDSDDDLPGINPAVFIAKLQVTAEPQSIRYYTIGEVGNHRGQASLWLLCDDDRFGFDIYDATGRSATEIQRLISFFLSVRSA